jgi:hypothetical protein
LVTTVVRPAQRRQLAYAKTSAARRAPAERVSMARRAGITQRADTAMKLRADMAAQARA